MFKRASIVVALCLAASALGQYGTAHYSDGVRVALYDSPTGTPVTMIGQTDVETARKGVVRCVYYQPVEQVRRDMISGASRYWWSFEPHGPALTGTEAKDSCALYVVDEVRGSRVEYLLANAVVGNNLQRARYNLGAGGGTYPYLLDVPQQSNWIKLVGYSGTIYFHALDGLVGVMGRHLAVFDTSIGAVFKGNGRLNQAVSSGDGGHISPLMCCSRIDVSVARKVTFYMDRNRRWSAWSDDPPSGSPNEFKFMELEYFPGEDWLDGTSTVIDVGAIVAAINAHKAANNTNHDELMTFLRGQFGNGDSPIVFDAITHPDFTLPIYFDADEGVGVGDRVGSKLGGVVAGAALFTEGARPVQPSTPAQNTAPVLEIDVPVGDWVNGRLAGWNSGLTNFSVHLDLGWFDEWRTMFRAVCVLVCSLYCMGVVFEEFRRQ